MSLDLMSRVCVLFLKKKCLCKTEGMMIALQISESIAPFCNVFKLDRPFIRVHRPVAEALQGGSVRAGNSPLF